MLNNTILYSEKNNICILIFSTNNKYFFNKDILLQSHLVFIIYINMYDKIVIYIKTSSI